MTAVGGPRSSAEFLRRGFRLLRTERPERHGAVCGLLEPIPGVYEIGEERITVTAKDGRLSVRKARSRRRLRAQANLDPMTILAVVDGTRTVNEALASEDFVVIGDAEALLALSEVVRIIADSAIRSSGLQRLFEEYRSWVLEKRATEMHSS